MKHVVKEQYKDLELKRILTEGAVLEEEYKKDNVELTEERINYLVDERKLCVAIEDKEDNKQEEVKEESDEQTKENNNEEVKQEDKEESKDKDNAKAKDKSKNNK